MNARLRSLLVCALLLVPVATLRGQAPPGPPDPASFSPKEVTVPPMLIHRLKAQADPVSAFVWSQLPEATRQLLADPAAHPAATSPALIEGLNSVLAGPSLYDPERFAAVALSPATLALISQSPQGEALVRLNRMLLEDAFGPELRRSPHSLLSGPGVSTDHQDYGPGSTANIHGWNFEVGETVGLRVVRIDGAPEDLENWSVVVGTDGRFESTWHVCMCLGATLRLTATGQASGRSAQAVFTDAGGAPTYEALKSFGVPSRGAYPQGKLIQGSDGALYGTAPQGGASGFGTVFKLNTDGTGLTVLKSFDNSSTGAYPSGRLLQGTDGALYGTALQGGSGGAGTVFKLNTDGTGFTVLKSLDASSTGGYVASGLTQGMDGALYGAAPSGTAGGFGAVFKLNTDGSGFTILKSFDYSSGTYPYSEVIQGTDGVLYGTARTGGSLGYGTLFKLNPDGTGFAVLQNFDQTSTGAYPWLSEIWQGTDGALYGTATQGGWYNAGTAFKLNTDGSGFTVLKHFEYSTGASPYGGVVQGSDGALYGTARVGGSAGRGTLFRMNTDGSGFTVLKNFVGSTGESPYAGVIQGTDGALYGTAREGGNTGFGTVFKLNTNGTGFVVLDGAFSLGSNVSMDGGYPSSVIQGTDGALYGTAPEGGSSAYGTVFRLNTDGSGFSVLKHLEYPTGGSPFGGVIQGLDGALYGTAYEGGSSDSGTVFRLNADGTGFTVLHDFDYDSNGGYPIGGLIQGSDGVLYGTASEGGSAEYGTVFRLNADGTGFAVLHDFDYDSTGGYPSGSLTRGTDGMLYGTAALGGGGGYGTVFRLGTDGTGFSVLQDFDYDSTGGYLDQALIQGTDGSLYGTAAFGGSSGYGTVFRLSTDGTGFSVLQDFDYDTTGGYLYSSLAQDVDGTLYGTASQGGSSGHGTLFRLNADGTDFEVLLNFDNATNGGFPFGNVVWGADDNLYGTTQQGGAGGAGTVFRLAYAPAPVDSVAPIAGPTQSPAANGSGWNNDDVTVSWNWTDEEGGSGIDTANCTQSSVSTGEGSSIVLAATCKDLAGNTGSAARTVKVDKTDPTVALIGGPADGGSYYYGTVPSTPTCAASDDLSGLAGCTVSGYGTAVGTHTVTATATDNADNTATASATYTVLALTLNGFYAPVNMGAVWNTVKNGATVPLKFEVFAGSTELTSTSIVNQPLTATQTACSGGDVDDIELLASGATSLRYEDGQFVYNWQTPKKPNFCYVVTVRLADGTAISANFKLK